MANRCSVCGHADRLAIDKELIGGLPYRDISGRYGVSKSALERHASAHVAQAISRARDLRDWLNADQLVGELRVLREVVLGVLEEARAAGDHSVALAACARLEKQAELVARLLGELVDRQRVEMVDATFSAQWEVMLPVMLRALEPYPEARAALIAALEPLAK
jgi:hypothetical protein